MLEEFIKANNVNAQILSFEKEVASAKSAAATLGVEISDIAKTILLLDEQTRTPLMVVLLGFSSADIEKISLASGLKEIVVAEKEMVPEITGYEAGGLPPISVYGVRTIIDEKVMQKKTVFAGGGNTHSILKISPQQIQEHGFEVTISDISAD